MANFIREMLSGEKNISSKRVNGTIGWLTAIVFIGIWQHDLIFELMVTSAALVGLDTIKSGISGLKNRKEVGNSEK